MISRLQLTLLIICLVKNVECGDLDLTRTLKVVYKNWFVGYCESDEIVLAEDIMKNLDFLSLNKSDCSKSIYF